MKCVFFGLIHLSLAADPFAARLWLRLATPPEAEIFSELAWPIFRICSRRRQYWLTEQGVFFFREQASYIGKRGANECVIFYKLSYLFHFLSLMPNASAGVKEREIREIRFISGFQISCICVSCINFLWFLTLNFRGSRAADLLPGTLQEK